jgi:hypothetical protein
MLSYLDKTIILDTEEKNIRRRTGKKWHNHYFDP